MYYLNPASKYPPAVSDIHTYYLTAYAEFQKGSISSCIKFSVIDKISKIGQTFPRMGYSTPFTPNREFRHLQSEADTLHSNVCSRIHHCQLELSTGMADGQFCCRIVGWSSNLIARLDPCEVDQRYHR